MCSVEGCDKTVYVKGKQLCRTHYVYSRAGKELKPLRGFRKADRVDEHGKSCTKCRRYQPYSEYNTLPDGKTYMSWCYLCKIESQRAS